MTTRASHIHAARAYLAQVPLFRAREEARGSGERYSLTLLEWAGNARRRALASCSTPAQGNLF